jgi:hypothetical protein
MIIRLDDLEQLEEEMQEQPWSRNPLTYLFWNTIKLPNTIKGSVLFFVIGDAESEMTQALHLITNWADFKNEVRKKTFILPPNEVIYEVMVKHRGRVFAPQRDPVQRRPDQQNPLKNLLYQEGLKLQQRFTS